MQAIVTATSGSYLKGTKVLLHSLLKYNPAYKGDLILIHDNLPASQKKMLSDLYPVKFHQVSETLKSSCRGLVATNDAFANSHKRFWSLDAFCLSQYHSVLFLDSDMLCQGDISELTNGPAAFGASPDMASYEGFVRDRNSFAKTRPSTDNTSTFQKVFNAGMFCFKPGALSENVYHELLALLNAETFDKVTSGHTDQYLLNLYFEEKVQWLDAGFNYLIRHNHLHKVDQKDAVLWHFIRNPKPWKLKKLARLKLTGALDLNGLKEWQKNYREVLRKEQNLKFTWTRLWELLLSKAIS